MNTLQRILFLHRLKGGGISVTWETISGTLPLTLLDAAAKPIKSLIRYGKVAQNGTPTPDAPVWPSINNGVVRMARPSGLPVRYQMVEWLTVTSPSKCITITDFKTKGTQELECKWYRSAQINCYLYASDASSSLTTNTTAYLATASGNWRFDGRAAGFSAPVKTICTSIQNKAGAWINGSKVGSYGDAGDFVSTNDLCILNGADSANVRFYYLKVRENDNLALDLVPVRDNMDGVYGVYDKISGEFYTNAEATFSAGADVEDTPYLTIDGTPEVLTVSENLFTVPILPRKTINGNGEVASNSTRSATQDGIAVDGGKTYTLAYAQSINNGVFFYDANDAFISYLAWGANPRTFTTPDNARYVRFSFATINKISDVRLVRDDAVQTATVPDLYAVGDYKDEAEVISGAVTRKVGMKVLDGTENWTLNGTMRYVLTISDMATLSGRTEGLCTHFSYAGSSANEGTYFLTSAKRMFVHTDFETVADWKAFLADQYAAGTPVIVLYPLAEEATESVTPQQLTTVEGTNTVSTVANVSPVDGSCEYIFKSSGSIVGTATVGTAIVGE